MKNMYAVEHSGKIIRHLIEFGTITSHEAIDEYSVFRVDRCISYLKKQGYKIDLEFKYKEGQSGEKICYGVYRLIENNM
jgi:hypothetical protein